jgi:uncharacterized membrane protein
MQEEKTPFYIYVLRIIFALLVLAFLIGFVYTLFSGQLSGTDPCSQYENSYEAWEFCVGNLG